MKTKKCNPIMPQKYVTPIPIAPGETIKEFLDELGMTQKELSLRMDISEKHLTSIIKGESEISRSTAEKLKIIFGIESRFWINLENDYREALAKLTPVDITEDECSIAKEIPYSELAKRNLVETTKKVKEKVINLRNFFGVSDLKSISCINAAYRKANIMKESKYALAAWIRIAEIKSRDIETKKFNRKKLEEYIPKFRSLTLEDPEVFYPKLVKMCAETGVALVVSNHLSGTGVHGVTFLNSKKSKLIMQLSVRGKFADKFWFTFFHELGHILCNKSSEIVTFDCDEEAETVADKIASDLLIPSSEYKKFLDIGEYDNIYAIKEFAKTIGIHHCIVIGRLKYDKKIPYNIFTREAPKLKINRE